MIIAIDPGWNRMGVAIGDNIPIIYKCIETPSTDVFEQRLFYIYKSLESLIKQNNLKVIVYEIPFLKGDNGAKLNQIIGIISLLGAMYKMKIVKFSASHIKKAVCKNGQSTKKDIEIAVRNTYSLPEKLLDDVYDAVAVFHCYKIENL